MKRKHDEGYALVFTLVVLLFLCIVAMSMMQLAGRDLEAQIASIDRMKAQYAAQGELEKIIASVERTEIGHLEELCADLNEADIEEPPVFGANEYQMTIHIEKSEEEYKAIIDCILRVYENTSRGTYETEYNSYDITTVENPNPPATEPENGGVDG